LTKSSVSRIIQAIWDAFALTGSQGEPPSESRWVLRGYVHRLVTCEPHQVGLGEELTSGEAGRTLDFKLRINGPVDRLRLKQVPNEWKAELVRTSQDLKNYILHASPLKRKSGAFIDAIELEAVSANGRVFRTQPITVEGWATDAVEVLPKLIDLGTVHVGEVARPRLWVRARNGGPINALDVVPADSLVKVVAVRSEGGEWCIDLEREIDERGLGTSSGLVRIKSPGASGGEAEFRLRWYGILK
jgi:hypothetical protein